MRQVGCLSYVLFVCLFSGCVCSVHPILKDSDLTTDLDLSGTWKPDGGQVRGVSDRARLKGYTFVAKRYSAGGESDYDIEWNGKEFHGQIGKIGDDYYVQFKRTELKPEIAPFLHAVPVYAIAKLKLLGENKLELFAIDEVRAPHLLMENSLDYIRYSPSEPIEYFVLTGSIESMQAKFREEGDRIFTKRMIYSRD